MEPMVSIIVPVYNNQVYVVTCVKSLLAQTLSDIEIICINDGSTDDSSKILHAFADQDDRVIVVDKENGGYGVGINTGLDMARGKYVTILESDDFADLDMLETLVGYAETFDCEIVRANFYLYWSKKNKNDHFLELFGEHECDRVIDPSIRTNQHCFYVQPALWSAIYRTDFIRDNKLRLTETPGAAYQDTAFNFKIWACAKRVMFVHKPFVHYRQDNEASSINNPGKVNNICIEYAEVRRWLREERPDLIKDLAPVGTKMMCDAYLWNVRRIAEEFRYGFACQFGKELKEAEEAGWIDPELYAPGQLAMVTLSMSDPQAFVDYACRGIDPYRGLKRVARKIETLRQVASQEGMRSARRLLAEKLLHDQGSVNIVDQLDNELATRKEPKFISIPVEEPKISVVVPVYNTASVLRETLESILAQSLTDFELICINDGSTDDSDQILADYAEKDCRLRVITQDNRGVAFARNRGLELASAPYTIILDSDDIYRHDMFELMYKKASDSGADVVVCGSCEYDGDSYETTPTPWALKLDQLPGKDVFTVGEAGGAIFTAFMGWPWDKLFRTDFLRQSGICFPVDLKNSEDGVFVYGLLARAQSIAVISDVLIKHRYSRTGSVSNSRTKHPECFYEATCMIKEGLKQNPDLYVKLEQGFLNWALDYAIWNISSLPDREVKRDLAKKLVSGKFTELEVKEHPWSYFDLYDFNMHARFAKLRLVALGIL